jgi:hypothetical protein
VVLNEESLPERVLPCQYNLLGSGFHLDDLEQEAGLCEPLPARRAGQAEKAGTE